MNRPSLTSRCKTKNNEPPVKSVKRKHWDAELADSAYVLCKCEGDKTFANKLFLKFCINAKATGVKSLEELLPHCDVNHTDRSGKTGLFLAALNGHLDIVYKLYNHKDIVTQVSDHRHHMELHAALFGKELFLRHSLYDYFEVMHRAGIGNTTSMQGTLPAPSKGNFSYIEKDVARYMSKHSVNKCTGRWLADHIDLVKVTLNRTRLAQQLVFLDCSRNKLGLLPSLLYMAHNDVNQYDEKHLLQIVELFINHPNYNMTHEMGLQLIEAAVAMDMPDILNLIMMSTPLHCNTELPDHTTLLGRCIRQVRPKCFKALMTQAAINADSAVNVDMIGSQITPLRMTMHYVGPGRFHSHMSECEIDALKTMFKSLVLHPSVDINRPLPDYDSSPIHEASTMEDPFFMKTLISNKKCKVGLKDSNSWTALHTAISNNRHDTACALLSDKKTSLEHAHKRQSPLFLAIGCLKPNMVKLLLCSGANIHSKLSYNGKFLNAAEFNFLACLQDLSLEQTHLRLKLGVMLHRAGCMTDWSQIECNTVQETKIISCLQNYHWKPLSLTTCARNAIVANVHISVKQKILPTVYHDDPSLLSGFMEAMQELEKAIPYTLRPWLYYEEDENWVPLRHFRTWLERTFDAGLMA